MANENTGSEQQKSRRPRTNYNITPIQFVDAWNSSNSAQEAADKLSAIAGRKVPKNIVLARAATYRAKKLNLKNMDKRNPHTINIDEINAHIKAQTEAAQAPQQS